MIGRVRLVVATALFTAVRADVSRRRWIRPGSRAFVGESYEHLVRGGSDTEHRGSIIESYDTSVCSVQGGRSYMEDEYCIHQNGAFAAVFDGHGGNAVSRYLRQNLYANVQAAAPVTSVQECVDALCNALDKVDREVNRISHWSFQGSTAVAVWIHSETQEERTVIAANVGDSRAVLSRNGSAINLTLDHKPDDAVEKARVEATGGKVVWCGGVDSMGKPVPNAGIYRVNGNLALSRAIGDRSERPAVTSKPDVSTYRIEEGDEFIVLGSDGLWDVMSSQEVVTFVHTTQWGAAPAVVSDEVTQQESDTTPLSLVQKKMADILVAEALRRGTTDNITVVVLWLKRRSE